MTLAADNRSAIHSTVVTTALVVGTGTNAAAGVSIGFAVARNFIGWDLKGNRYGARVYATTTDAEISALGALTLTAESDATIVAEVGARRLIAIVPETGKVTEIAANLPIGLTGAPSGLPTHIPTGVAVGATGTIYVSSDVENAIYKVTKK